tara:strand:- start:8961 stop:9539 length:579 start_codon:yes stop_codon:yes gene_type:complete
MLQTFLFFLKLGYYHVLDLDGLDHFYFFIVISLPFTFKKGVQLLKWVTLFTLGHCLTLFLNYYFNISTDLYWIEALIPITIMYSSAIIIFQNIGSSKKYRFKYFTMSTLFLGLIHGVGFGRYFNLLVQEDSSFTSLLGFAFGIEVAQIIIVSFVLVLNSFIIKFSEDKFIIWIRSGSCLIFILSLKMLFERL